MTVSPDWSETMTEGGAREEFCVLEEFPDQEQLLRKLKLPEAMTSVRKECTLSSGTIWCSRLRSSHSGTPPEEDPVDMQASHHTLAPNSVSSAGELLLRAHLPRRSGNAWRTVVTRTELARLGSSSFRSASGEEMSVSK